MLWCTKRVLLPPQTYTCTPFFANAMMPLQMLEDVKEVPPPDAIIEVACATTCYVSLAL
jgi:hypothetical protein